MHKTLARQLEHHIKDDGAVPAEWQELLDAISGTYESFDRDRILIERSLEISSRELKEFISMLQATLDSTSEGIIVINNKDELMNHNKRFVEIWGIDEETLRTRDVKKTMALMIDKVTNSFLFGKNMDVAHTQPNEKSEPFVVKFKDGRTVEVNSRPQMIEGVSVGRVWSFRDVTNHLGIQDELRTKLDALERLNKAMIDRELKMIELKKEIARLQEQCESQK